MGSREPKHLSCPTHGAVWGTIYADGAVDYDCGCHATPTPPAPADDASGAKPVAWAVRDRHGQYGEPSRDEAKIRRDCDYLNRDSSTPYYIGQGPYEVVPLAPLPASDDAVEEAARALLNARRRDGCLYCVCGRLMTGNVAHQPDCAWERLDAALRREKGGDK